MFRFKALLIYIFILLCSCAKEVDFSQANDIEINPVLESSIIYFNAPAPYFYNNGEILISQDFVLIDIFNNKFTVDYLRKVEFIFESTNSINRTFQLNIDFVDKDNITQYSVLLSAPLSPNNHDVVTENSVVFEGEDLLALKRAEKLVFTIRLQSGAPIDDTALGEIALKSKGVFYFTIDNSQ